MFCLSAFAGYYDRDDSSSFLFWIIVLVVGILQIILFFKIWGMTGDVREMKNYFIGSNKPLFIDFDSVRNVIKNKYYKGYVDEAYNILNDYTFYRLGFLESFVKSGDKYIYDEFNQISPEEHKERVFKEVLPLYRAIGREIPENLKNITVEELQEFGQVKE